MSPLYPENGGLHIGFQASDQHLRGYWSGLIDDVRIYNQAIKPEEIEKLAQ